MKRLLALMTAIAITGSAHAADFSTPMLSIPFAPPSAAPQGSGAWTGPFISAHIGAALTPSKNSRGTAVLPTGLASPDVVIDPYFGKFKSDESLTLGIGVGYDMAFGDIVLGAEADIAYLDSGRRAALSGVASDGLGDRSYSGSATQRTEWLSTVRARAGYLFAPNLLGYMTGGLAFANVDTNATVSYAAPGFASQLDTGVISTSRSRTKVGYALGAGVEYKLSPDLAIRGEYLFADLGSERIVPVGDNASGSIKVDNHHHLLRAGLTYRFQ